MVKSLIFFIIVCLMTVTAGVSYKSYFTYEVMVFAEEEERSSEQSLDEIKVKLHSSRLNQAHPGVFCQDDTVNEKYKRPCLMYWSSANTDLYDIPPEKEG